MTCIIDMAVRNHAHNEGILDDYQDAINARILELTAKGGEFYPFDPRNMRGQSMNLRNHKISHQRRSLFLTLHKKILRAYWAYAPF